MIELLMIKLMERLMKIKESENKSMNDEEGRERSWDIDLLMAVLQLTFTRDH